jgi:hypothetical protein
VKLFHLPMLFFSFSSAWAFELGTFDINLSQKTQERNTDDQFVYGSFEYDKNRIPATASTDSPESHVTAISGSFD